MIDANIRRLVGQHFHVIRKFGLQGCTVNEWASCHEINKTNVLTAVKHQFKYPKDSFSWYKSAEVHTHKRNIPMRVWFLLFVPIFLVVLGFIFWRSIGLVKPRESGEAVSPAAAGVVKYVPPRSLPERKTHLSTLEYLAIREPRIEGLPHTAPVYDDVTKPQQAPEPVGCMISEFCGWYVCRLASG